MADVQHSGLTGTNIHVPGYVQATDPGAIGAGKLWVDTSAGAGLWVTKIRNATDTGWENAGSGADGASGYSGYSGISGFSGAGGSSSHFSAAITDGDLVAGIATIVHNLSDFAPVVAVYDNNFKKIIPDEIQVSDANTILIDFTSYAPLTGTWNIKVIV